jgi:hypothetical protein
VKKSITLDGKDDNMQGINEINYKDMEIGNYTFSDFTNSYYIVSALPNITTKGQTTYALVRLDGRGYYYASNSLEELKEKISQDCETTIFKELKS